MIKEKNLLATGNKEEFFFNFMKNIYKIYS